MNNVQVQLYDIDGNLAYPRPYYRVGDILESTNPNNPAEDGYIGTWELYGKGRVTVCIDSNDSKFNTIGKEIGESEHVLTVNEMPSHQHNCTYRNNGKYLQFGDGGSQYSLSWANNGYNGDAELIASATGGSQSHNNVQPSVVVYRWRRIA